MDIALTYSETDKQYDEVVQYCREIFLKKNNDYGTSWKILRSSSVTDQIFIKASRLRSIEEKGEQKVQENIFDEYAGIVNYCIMGLMILQGSETLEGQNMQELLEGYDQEVHACKQLMQQKNHDYGEAWREMRIKTYTDLILSKLLRIRQIEDNQGKTLISEGIASNYQDILNYAVFALIRLKEDSV